MSRNMFNSESLALFMERVDLANTKIQSIVNFATKAKFVLDGEETTADLSQFIPQYVEEICTIFAGSDIEISVDNNSEAFVLTFKPIEFFIVIDNLVHNAKKAEANKIEFNLFNPEKNQLVIEVTDDGNGLDASIKDIPSIFEKGITTTPGSGLGLYHSKQLISEMGGSISAEIGEKRDIKFKLEFAQ